MSEEISFIEKVKMFFQSVYYYMKGNPEGALRNDLVVQKRIMEFEEAQESLEGTLRDVSENPQKYLENDTGYEEGSEEWKNLVEEILEEKDWNYNDAYEECRLDARLLDIGEDTTMQEFKDKLERQRIG